jgi:hypothetical protein
MIRIETGQRREWLSGTRLMYHSHMESTTVTDRQYESGAATEQPW